MIFLLEDFYLAPHFHLLLLLLVGVLIGVAAFCIDVIFHGK